MLKRWKHLSSKIILKNPWWTYRLDAFQIPGGISGEYHCVHTEGSSMVVPLLPDGRLVLVKQYRFLCDTLSIEFPCGGVKPGSTHDDMARCELEEETGYQAGQWKIIGEFNPFNGVTDEFCRVYLASELRLGASQPDSTEEFEVHQLTVTELESLISRGEIWDGMTLAAWQLAKPFIHNPANGVNA